jgi:superfamily II DNA/RNA helicase
MCPEDYLHRIGRTGRAGASGNALSFISPEDHSKWRAIDRLINQGKTTKREDTLKLQNRKKPFRDGNKKDYLTNGKKRYNENHRQQYS